MQVNIIEAVKYAVDMKSLHEETLQFLMQCFGCARKVYNLYVDFLYQKLEKEGYINGDELPALKLPEVSSFKKIYPYLKKADSLALSNAKIDFEDAVKRYNKQSDHMTYTKRAKQRAESGTEPLTFRGLAGMPKFHARAKGHFSYTTNCQYPNEKNSLVKPTIRLEGNVLFVPKIKKGIKLFVHRKLPENAVIKNVTLSMNPAGQIFIAIGYNREIEIDLHIRETALSGDMDKINTLKFLGLDYSQPYFYVDSEGRKANYPKFYRESEEKLARYQKQLSQMEKGSKNYEKKLRQIQKLHIHIANQRKDFLHKLSRKLVNTYDVIVVEDINLRAMGQALRLAKNLHDNGFGMFRDFLSYKLERKGSVLVKVGRFFASTKTCNVCGEKNPAIVLGVDEWICPHCGTHHLRDDNAAVNIREEGKKIFSSFYSQWLEEEEKTKERAEKRSASRKKKKSIA